MIRSQTLYVNVDSTNPQTALVRSVSNTQPVTMGSLVAGDTARYIIYLLDSTGAISSLSGDANMQVTVALGGLGDGPYVTSSNFVASGSNSWTGSINTDTGSLLTALGTEDTLSTYFEIQLIVTGSVYDSGSVYTVLQAPLTVRNQVIPN